MKKRTFLKYEKPLLTCMVQAADPDRIKELIDASVPAGAEAIGMQAGREAEGISKLTAFAKTRDAAYEYNAQMSFRDNVWWQRRVELFGESALATFDIKRLNKGITRSYTGTNHIDGYH